VTTPGQRQGFLGYATLVALVVGGLAGGIALGGAGLAAYFGAAEQHVRNAKEGAKLASSLESALVWWSFGVLSLLVAVIAFVVLLKGLSDDVARARRGPV